MEPRHVNPPRVIQPAVFSSRQKEVRAPEITSESVRVLVMVVVTIIVRLPYIISVIIIPVTLIQEFGDYICFSIVFLSSLTSALMGNIPR